MKITIKEYNNVRGNARELVNTITVEASNVYWTKENDWTTVNILDPNRRYIVVEQKIDEQVKEQVYNNAYTDIESETPEEFKAFEAEFKRMVHKEVWARELVQESVSIAEQKEADAELYHIYGRLEGMRTAFCILVNKNLWWLSFWQGQAYVESGYWD